MAKATYRVLNSGLGAAATRAESASGDGASVWRTFTIAEWKEEKFLLMRRYEATVCGPEQRSLLSVWRLEARICSTFVFSSQEPQPCSDLCEYVPMGDAVIRIQTILERGQGKGYQRGREAKEEGPFSEWIYVAGSLSQKEEILHLHDGIGLTCLRPTMNPRQAVIASPASDAVVASSAAVVSTPTDSALLGSYVAGVDDIALPKLIWGLPSPSTAKQAITASLHAKEPRSQGGGRTHSPSYPSPHGRCDLAIWISVRQITEGFCHEPVQAEQDMLWPDSKIYNHFNLGSRPISDPFQIFISQPSGKTCMQWVSPTDLVQELTLQLECRLGIPSSLMRLLSQGKQLEDHLPLSAYSISRNSVVVANLRLRGGTGGQTSSSKPFSYKDAVHSENPKSTEAPKSKVFLVDKIEEVPFVEFMHEELASQQQEFADRAIICRFNGLWPRSQDLYAWIYAHWTHNCKVFFCSKGYFIVLFKDNEHYEQALEKGPWFMGNAGLFLTPWFPDFDPDTATITKTPVWIRLPNFPAHLWNTRVFRVIGNTLGFFLGEDSWRESKGLYSYARLCAELDLSKGLPEQINLKINDLVWTQTLDYENTAFRCRHCHQSGHLQNTCPSRPAKKSKANASNPKPKRWTPCSPPPGVDHGSSSTEDEDSDEELEQVPSTVAPATDGVAPSSDSANAQKRVHLSSSSESEKESFPKAGTPTGDPNLQVVIAHPPQNGWVAVKNRKGKKPRVGSSTLEG